MALVVTANTGANTLILSTSIWNALATAATSHFGSGGNTNIGLLAASYLAQGLRNSADNRMSEGAKGTGGITVSYLEGTLIPNSE